MTEPDRPEDFIPGRDAALIFNEQIRPFLTGQPQSDPVVLWVGGQPGAGKSTVQSAILRRLGRSSAFPLDGDDLLTHHPRYAELHAKNDLSGAQLAAENIAGRWWSRAARILRALRIDTVISAPLAGPAWAAEQFRKFRKAQFRVEVAFVATHEAISLQGVVDRYRGMKADSPEGVGRWVLPEWHEIAGPGVLATADMIHRTKAAHALYIGVRGGGLIHTNELEGGRLNPRTGELEGAQWKLAVLPSQVIEAERRRPWTVAESAAFLQKQGELRAWLPADTWGPLLDTIDRKAVPVINPMAVLSDRQLAQLQTELPQSVERAALQVDIAQARAGVLAERHRNGTNEGILQQMQRNGAGPAAVDQARTELNRERWAASMTVGKLARHADELATLNSQVRSEMHRRAGLDPATRAAEEHGRRQHRAVNPEADIARVLPTEPVPVVIASPATPAPRPSTAEPASAAAADPVPAKSAPQKKPRKVAKRLDDLHDRDARGAKDNQNGPGRNRRRDQPPPQRPGGPSI